MIKIETPSATEDLIVGAFYIILASFIEDKDGNKEYKEPLNIIKIEKYLGDDKWQLMAKAEVLPEYIESFFGKMDIKT